MSELNLNWPKGELHKVELRDGTITIAYDEPLGCPWPIYLPLIEDSANRNGRVGHDSDEHDYDIIADYGPIDMSKPSPA